MPSATTRDHFSLTAEQKSHFLDYGFVKIENCFSREAAAEYTASIWTRLGASPDDKSTWPTTKMNLPGHTVVSLEEFSPKAYDAIADILGGKERLAEWSKLWHDGFIVNFGHPDYKPTDTIDFRNLNGWHTDGNWFAHFLDSPEQALLVTPLYSDIGPGGGGTVVCADSIRHVARHMYNHPSGTTPFLQPWGTPDPGPGDHYRVWNEWVRNPKLACDKSFFELTGNVGDVFLIHPMMLHSASRNVLRNVRIINNAAVSLKVPFNYNRTDPKDYSLVEQKTLRDLGRPEGIPEWKMTGKRQLIKTENRKLDMLYIEQERLKKAGVPATTLKGARPLDDSVYFPA